MTISQPNSIRFGKTDTYLVRSQAGFRKAVKQQMKEWELDHVIGYPHSYPSLVVFSQGYEGYFYLEASCHKLSKLYWFLAENDYIALKKIVELTAGGATIDKER